MTDTILRHEPKQDRSTKTLAHLTEAARQCAAEQGLDRFTTADVAVRAGVSIGTVYRYFPDRVAILDVIQPGRHDVEALRSRIQEAIGYAEMTAVTIEGDVADERGRPWSPADQLAFIDGLLGILTGTDSEEESE